MNNAIFPQKFKYLNLKNDLIWKVSKGFIKCLPFIDILETSQNSNWFSKN